MKKYRIVRDNAAGFSVQFKVWWWPFWIEAHEPGYICNTWCTIEGAENFAKYHAMGCVKYVDFNKNGK